MKVLSSLTKFKNDISFAIGTAHKSIVWIDSFDYGYIKKMLDDLSSNNKSSSIFYWSNSTGKLNDSSGKQKLTVKVQRQDEKAKKVVSIETDVINFTEALKWFVNTSKYTRLVLRVSEKDFEEKESIPTLQNFVYLNNEKPLNEKRTIVLVAASHFEVIGLEHLCERFTLPLPDIEDIDEILGFATYVNKNNETYRLKDGKVFRETHTGNLDPEPVETEASKGIIIRNEYNIVIDKKFPSSDNLQYPLGGDILNETNFMKYYQELTDLLCGMHLMDIKELLNTLKLKGKGTINYGYEDREKAIELPQIISDRKKQIVNNSGLLEVVDYEDNYYENVADIDNILNHINSEIKRINNPGNYPPNLPKPKGILLVGAPGCGKSESAKAIASQLNKPLYRLNIGNLLGHKYGQSENRFIEALRTADASAPCVLWIDEIEKAFAGAGNESENDDTLTHIVGHFLTWMQEHKTMVYLVATANDLSRMKPEMLRKGRWDERFYLSYPSQQGCEKILYAITQKKLKVRVSFKDSVVFKPQKNGYTIQEETKERLDIITKLMYTMQMSGAEIENVIIKTINNHPISKDGKWYVDLDDIGDTIIREIISLKYCPKWIKPGEEKAFETLKETLKEEIESNPQKKISDDILEKMTKFGDGGKDVDYFLNKQIDEDILNAQIKSCEKWKEEDDKRKDLSSLLLEKYKEKYCFTPACLI